MQADVKFAHPPSRAVILSATITIVLVSFAVYSNALFNGFVYDDKFQVLKNPWITDFRYIPTVFSSEAWGFKGDGISNYYRPMMHVFYMIAYRLFGLDAWGYHAMVILFHTGVSVLVFLLTYRILAHSGITFPLVSSSAAVILFITHPIHTEAVTPVMSITEPSFAFFYILAFYLYIRCKEKNKTLCPFSVLSFLLAALCKETALTLPVVLAAYDLVFDRKQEKRKDIAIRYAPYLFAGVLYFGMRLHALGSLVPLNRHSEFSIYQSLVNIFPLIIRYLGKFLVPVNLNAKYEFHPYASLFDTGVILSLAGTILLLSIVYLSARRAKTVFLGLCLAAVPLLPTLYIRAIPYPFAERYLYLPSVGFALILASCVAWIITKPKGPLALAVVLPMIVGLYAYGTIRRNQVWKDEFSLWSDTVTKSPHDATSRANLGYALLSRGRVNDAIEQYKTAVSLEPNSEMFKALGVAYTTIGQADKAVEAFDSALKIQPNDATTYNDIGAAYQQSGMLDKAIERYETALKLNPGLPDTHYNIGLAYQSKGLLDNAIKHFEIAVRLNPNDGEIRGRLAGAYEMKKRSQKNGHEAKSFQRHGSAIP